MAYIGDGACNVPLSWIFAADKLDFQLRIAAPKAFQPSQETQARAGKNLCVTEKIPLASAAISG